MPDYEKRKIRELKELNPGDHIQVPGGGKKKSLYDHHLLVVRVINSEQIRVIHKTMEDGVVEEVHTYKPEEITVLDYNSKYMGEQAICRAREMANGRLGGRYNLLEDNCEHFVFEVRTGEKKSEQVKDGVLVALGLLIIAILLIRK